MIAVTSNRLACWVCTKFPTMSSTGLSWWIDPANASTWDWFHTWDSTDATLYSKQQHVYTLVWEWVNCFQPWLFFYWDSVGWLIVLQVEFHWSASLCIERWSGMRNATQHTWGGYPSPSVKSSSYWQLVTDGAKKRPCYPQESSWSLGGHFGSVVCKDGHICPMNEPGNVYREHLYIPGWVLHTLAWHTPQLGLL